MDTGNKSFEGQVRQAFVGAELVPGERVWSGLELYLDEPALASRRVTFYKWLAAACLLVAAFSAGLNIYLLNKSDSVAENQLAIDDSHQSAPPLIEEQAQSLPEEPVSISEPRTIQEDESSPQLARSVDKPVEGDRLQLGLTPIEQQSLPQFSIAELTLKAVSPETQNPTEELKPSNNRQLITDNSELDIADNKQENEEPVGLELSPEDSKETKKKKESRDSRLFASLGFGAGSFNPDATQTIQAASPAPGSFQGGGSSALSTGSSYSAGFNMGARVGKRMVLMGGVSYLNQNTSFMSSVAQESAVSGVYLASSFADAAVRNTSNVVQTSAYDVSSTLEYISVPLQAGYLLVDRKFGFQLNGGVSTDFFLKNTLESDATGVQKSSQGGGMESPYTSVGFSGLFNTELSYRFGERYRLSLNPGMRYSLNSLYKTTTGLQSQPLTLDVGLRLRYLFK